MNDFLYTLGETVAYLGSAFVLFFIGKLVYQLIHRKINMKDELVKQDNFAFAVAQTGYYTGLLLAIGGSIMGESYGLQQDLIDIGIYGLISIVLLNLSIIINDKIILSKFSVYKEIIEDRNAGTGVVEAASAIGTGLIIMASVYGEGGGIETAFAFWGAGQVALILTTIIYNMILPYNIHEHIEKDNVAVGIGTAGAMIAIANLIRDAIMHDFTSWQEMFIEMGIDIGVGLVFLPVVRFLTDKILLPGEKLTDEIVNQEKPNVGAALIEAFAYIGGSILITWCF